MKPEEILLELGRFPSAVERPNPAIAPWIEDYLAGFGMTAQLLPGSEGDRAGLFATVDPRDLPGLILWGHMGVAPDQEPQRRCDP